MYFNKKLKGDKLDISFLQLENNNISIKDAWHDWFQNWVLNHVYQGVYPLRYLIFCVTDVSGVYSGIVQGPVLFEF